MNFAANSRSIAVIYRVYYKVMTTTLNPRSKHSLTRNETIIFEANTQHSKISTPKRLKWNELSQAGSWELSDICQPRIQELTESSSTILEQTDGSVQIIFESNQDNEPKITRTPSVSSAPSIQSFYIPRKQPSLTRSLSTPLRIETELRNVNFNSNIPQPMYNEIRTSSPESSISPTRSQMEAYGSINMITIEFQIDKELLKKDYFDPSNDIKRDWFLNNFESSKRIEIRETWYSNLRNLKMNIPFFIWFSHYSKIYNVDYPFDHLNVNTNITKNWKTLDNTEIVDIHPPLEGITFTVNNTAVIATPFKSFTQNNTEDTKQSTKRDIKNIQCQNNFTNQILSTIANQLTRVEDTVNMKTVSSSSFP